MRKKTSKIRLLVAASEPDVLKLIGDESRRQGTNTLSSRHIDEVIKLSRAQKPKHR
jgi:hypothetical protein